KKKIVTTQPSLRAAALVLPWHRPPGQVWRRSTRSVRVVERGLLRARTRTPSQHLHRTQVQV
ncbi:MAG: hypothetical protein Q7T89_00475, partial [Anaerolineales bacterium]|nr:hypothetical protein [Anaerolineales bacterium]